MKNLLISKIIIKTDCQDDEINKDLSNRLQRLLKLHAEDILNTLYLWNDKHKFEVTIEE